MPGQIGYFKKKGDPYILITSLGLIFSLAMVIYILVIILAKGLGFFWPGDLVEAAMKTGEKYLGELWSEDEKSVSGKNGATELIPEIQLKIGNRDILGRDFIWLPDPEIEKISYPDEATTIEREENGNFYGFIRSVQFGESSLDRDQPGLMDTVKMLHSRALDLSGKIEGLENRLTELTEPLVRLQREISLLEISPDSKAEQGKARLEKMYDESDKLEAETGPEYQKLTGELEKLKSTNAGLLLNMSTADGRDVDLPFSKIVRIYQPNRMGVIDKSLLYASKLAEFVAADPRESNTEGGVFPAIFGTVMMVLLMSVAVVPFGVLAAVYLNEYARQGTVTRLIRLSVNNLAGVPSIVFGIFGLGFFIYMVGGSIDQLFFSERLPEPTFGTGGILWASLTLALLTLPVVVVATEEGILAVPRANKEGALALGATKWQMIRKIVLPNAMPGILTGIILAISRGAGEVAPLMITGVVKLAPTLPFDLTFPFLHLDRKFMHLGFHIYDVGFQSPNVEAAKPMVYSTALLLILIVILLNILAIYIRNRLRKKYKSAAF
jgi:phosphate transport system permease protein